jgi:hypothetical protein
MILIEYTERNHKVTLTRKSNDLLTALKAAINANNASRGGAADRVLMTVDERGVGIIDNYDRNPVALFITGDDRVIMHSCPTGTGYYISEEDARALAARFFTDAGNMMILKIISGLLEPAY